MCRSAGIDLTVNFSSSTPSSPRRSRTPALTNCRLPVFPFPEKWSYCASRPNWTATFPQSLPDRSQAFQSCLAAPASFGPTRQSASARRNDDFPAPLSPRITFQLARRPPGDRQSKCLIERTSSMYALRMYIQHYSCTLRIAAPPPRFCRSGLAPCGALNWKRSTVRAEVSTSHMAA